MADYSAVNRGEYPERSMWRSRQEKIAFSAMILYIIACTFAILWYYTWGGV